MWAIRLFDFEDWVTFLTPLVVSKPVLPTFDQGEGIEGLEELHLDRMCTRRVVRRMDCRSIGQNLGSTSSQQRTIKNPKSLQFTSHST